MARSDLPFIHSGDLELSWVRVIDLTKDCMTEFSTRKWWIPWQDWSLLRVILEKRCLRLGKRNEEDTRVHCLSKRVSSPTAAITLSMMSCGISIDFSILVCVETRVVCFLSNGSVWTSTRVQWKRDTLWYSQSYTYCQWQVNSFKHSLVPASKSLDF